MDIGKFIKEIEEQPVSFPQEWINEPAPKEKQPV